MLHVLLSGTEWMSWTLLGSVAVSTAILLQHRDSYNRLDVDMPVLPPETDAQLRSQSTSDGQPSLTNNVC